MRELKPCDKCPYKLGLVKTLINPCPQCKATGYKMFGEFSKKNESNSNKIGSHQKNK